MVNGLVLRQVFSKLACSHESPGCLFKYRFSGHPTDWLTETPEEWSGNLPLISTPADPLGQTRWGNGSEVKEAVKDSLDVSLSLTGLNQAHDLAICPIHMILDLRNEHCNWRLWYAMSQFRCICRHGLWLCHDHLKWLGCISLTEWFFSFCTISNREAQKYILNLKLISIQEAGFPKETEIRVTCLHSPLRADPAHCRQF